MTHTKITEEEVTSAWTSTREDLHNAETVSKKIDIIEAYVEKLARGTVDETVGEPFVDAMLTSLAELDSHNTGKRAINKKYKQSIEKLERETLGLSSSTPRKTLNETILTKLDRLIVTRSTDAHEDTVYSWYFEDANSAIETTGQHRDPSLFARLYFDKTGKHVTTPEMNTPFYEWIQIFIENYLEQHPGDERLHYGPRTHAVEDLRERLGDTVAVTDPTVAYREDLIYIEDEDADTLHVSTYVIQRLLSPHESVTPRGLQLELGDARGYLTRPARNTTLPDGTQIRWWCIDRDWVEPKEINTERSAGETGGESELDEWGMVE